MGKFAVLTAGNSKRYANASDTPAVQEGANLGDTILYAAGDFTVATPVFHETSTWAPETIVTQDLHLGSAPSTPQILKIQGIVTQPAQGGNQFVFLCNPTFFIHAEDGIRVIGVTGVQTCALPIFTRATVADGEPSWHWPRREVSN